MLDQWQAIQRVLGRWEGAATGRPGTGHQVREYKAILRDRFILGTNRTRWDPTPEHPDGDLHEDMSIINFDPTNGQLVMRGFYSEGFVHIYRCIAAADDASRLVFEAGQVEGGPPGMRARETIAFMNPDALESTFELAMPGGEYEPYTHETLRRSEG